jgi:tetratricopeptide (TPR) repeat protein
MELLGHLNKAMEYYSKAIQIDPHHFMPYYNLGNCYKQQGKFFHAIEQYNNSISNNDRFINTWIALSSCYFELREIENCKKALSKAHELEPMHPMVQQNIQIINSTFGVEFF